MEEAGEFLTELLDCGVQVIGQPMAGVESAALGILVGTGARDEHDGQFGISHFTEQMLFRGTEHFDARELSERFDALGIEYDSSAGLEMTLLSAVLIGDRLPAAVDLLADVLRFPSFPADAVDTVRTVQVQELRQREDRPAQKVMDAVRQKFFAGSPLGHDSLGSEETLAAVTRDDLLTYWQERYNASNMLISVAGNFDWPVLVDQLQRVTAGWLPGRGRMHVDAPLTHAGMTALHRDASQENIGFAFPGVPIGDPDYYAAGLLAQALGGSSTSRLFREVREKRGLAYTVQARFDGLEKTGLYRVYVGTSVDRAHESVEVVLDELRKLELEGITDDELRLSKTSLKSHVIMRSESTSARMASNLRNWWFEGRLYRLDEVRDRIDSVTVEQVKELAAKLGVTDRLAAVALGPRTEADLFGGVLSRN